MPLPPPPAGGGSIKKIASLRVTRLSVTNPTGPTVTLTPKAVVGTTVVTGNATSAAQTLTATGTKTAHWATPAASSVTSYASGYWYGPRATSSTPKTVAKGRLYFTPLVLGGAFTVKAIGCRVGTAVATSTVRLGLYRDSGHFQPKALILDLTVVSAATTGAKTKAATHALTPGVYWLVVVRQGTSAVGTLKLRHIWTTSTRAGMYGVATLNATGITTLMGWRSTTVTFTGALPATAPALVALTLSTTTIFLAAKSA